MLGPDDHAEGLGLIPAPDLDAVTMAGIPSKQNPVAVTAAFYNALTGGRLPYRRQLRPLVTVPSWTCWGDFAAARSMVQGCGLATNFEYAGGGLAYTWFIDNPGSTSSISDSHVLLLPDLVCSLLVDNSTRSFRVHALGEPWHPRMFSPEAEALWLEMVERERGGAEGISAAPSARFAGD